MRLLILLATLSFSSLGFSNSTTFLSSPGFNGTGQLGSQGSREGGQLISPGSCGQAGCGNSRRDPIGKLTEVLKDSDVRRLVGALKIKSIEAQQSFFENYEINLEGNLWICARVEFTELPLRVDGKSTVAVGDQNILISATQGQCQAL